MDHKLATISAFFKSDEPVANSSTISSCDKSVILQIKMSLGNSSVCAIQLEYGDVNTCITHTYRGHYTWYVEDELETKIGNLYFTNQLGIFQKIHQHFWVI